MEAPRNLNTITFLIFQWRRYSHLIITGYCTWEDKAFIRFERGQNQIIHVDTFNICARLRAQKQYVLPSCFQNGTVPSLLTRWGPLKLYLYSNLTWRSLPSATVPCCTTRKRNAKLHSLRSVAILNWKEQMVRSQCLMGRFNSAGIWQSLIGWLCEVATYAGIDIERGFCHVPIVVIPFATEFKYTQSQTANTTGVPNRASIRDCSGTRLLHPQAPNESAVHFRREFGALVGYGQRSETYQLGNHLDLYERRLERRRATWRVTSLVRKPVRFPYFASKPI